MCSSVATPITLANITRFWISAASELGTLSFAPFPFGNLTKEANAAICCMLTDKHLKYLLTHNRENPDYLLEASLESQ